MEHFHCNNLPVLWSNFCNDHNTLLEGGPRRPLPSFVPRGLLPTLMMARGGHVSPADVSSTPYPRHKHHRQTSGYL